MAELKVKSKFFAMEDKVEVNDSEFNTAVEGVIQADKDIISKIELVYDEDNDLTFVNFPIGVMPLSITLNTHTLYFKNTHPVNEIGEPVEGYDTDELYCSSSESYIAFLGDLSEQVVNDLIYVIYDGEPNFHLGSNSYYLFYPVTSGGTKLYKHLLSSTSAWQNVVLVSTSPTFEGLSETNIVSVLEVSTFGASSGIKGVTISVNHTTSLENVVLTVLKYKVEATYLLDGIGTIDIKNLFTSSNDTVTPL